MQSIIYVGMDVHSQTVSLAATRGGKSNVIARAEVSRFFAKQPLTARRKRLPIG